MEVDDAWKVEGSCFIQAGGKAVVEIFGIYMAHTSEKSDILIENIFEIFGIFYSFPLAMTIEQEGNEVVFFLLSFSDLSHHRMCGPAKKHSRTPGSLYI